ncbi:MULTISPECIES: YobI family P-loop NTPase [Planococcus]|uniref:YobI family P-loop NTPase n=1 Tax=Planococcus TaxID=1372 RepID=UPI00115F38C0|nr:hypothetical protein [Planococcus soli]
MTNNNEIRFNKLTPINNSDLNTYEEALNFVFNNEDIKNIAITGPYGAGKTSLINSYKERNPEKVFINISLAHFHSDKSTDDNSHDEIPSEEKKHEEEKANQFSEESVLEAKILNQLLHQIDTKKIPKTNFKIKQKVPRKRIIFNTFLLLFLGICCLFLISFNSWVTYISQLSEGRVKNTLLLTAIPELKLFIGILIVLIIAKFLFDLFVIQNNRNIFKTLSLQGNQIEILEESDDSYFDKYLNEVLYIFENSSAHAIIFEDIDRYNANQIFGKLREINTLINNKKKKNKKNNTSEPLRFIFSLRDDVFVSKDRTKFFDFILPVVPVLDGSNSYEQFLKQFKSEIQENTLDTKFLQGISLYVDDMRILKNIYNEFLVYKSRLNTIELDFNKLLALVTYKNIFPRDFSELQLNSGFVYHLFNQKYSFLNNELADIEQELKEKQSLLSQLHNEEIKSIEELDAIYFHTPHKIHLIGGHPISNFSSRVELVKALRDNASSVTVINYQRYSSNENTINLEQDFKILDESPEYVERRDVIQSKNELEEDRLHSEIQQLKKAKNSLNNKKLQNIITRGNIEVIFKSNYTNEIGTENKFEKIKSSPYFLLIKYLIRNGYIDETYPDYMTYFYDTSLSIGDKIFLRSISDEDAKEYTYSLKDPKLLVSRLNISDFQSIEILNFELLNYLLRSPDSNPLYLENYIKQLEESKNFNFVEEFFELRTNIIRFINVLNSFWPHFFEEVIVLSDCGEPVKRQIALDLLVYSNADELDVINSDNHLTDYISNNEDFLNLEDPDTSEIIDKLVLLNVSFKDINFENSHRVLLREVYEMKLFALNYPLITKFLQYRYVINSGSSVKHMNYSLIMSKKDESLYNYVLSNIQEYLEIILANCEGKITDDQTAILDLMNNIDIEYDTKIQYLESLENTVENIEEIEDAKLWPTILNNHIAAYKAQNILSYFFKTEKGLDSYLINFIDEFDVEIFIDPDDVDACYEEDASLRFFEDVIRADSLSDKQYAALLQPFDLQYDSFPFEDISNMKVEILIHLGIITMSEENLNFIRVQYKGLIKEFIVKNIDAYLSLLNAKIFSLEEALLLLEAPISIERKLAALEYNESVISLRDKNLVNEIKEYIIENHFDEEDFQFLLNNFGKERPQIQEKIKDLISEKFSYVIDKDLSITFELLKELFLHHQLSHQQKKQLLASTLNDFNAEQAYELLSILDLHDYVGLFDRRRPKISKTPIDEQLLTIFKRKKWITKYEVDKDNPKFFRAFGKKIV